MRNRRSQVSIGGVVLSAFLILTKLGLNQAFSTMMNDMITGANAVLWITTKGSSGSFLSPAHLLLSLQDNLTAIPGVQEAVPLIRTPISVELHDGKVLLYINGYNEESGMGGPWSVIERVSSVHDEEVIIDKAFGKKHEFEVGGNLTIGDADFNIVGISDRTNLMIAYMVFYDI